MFNTRYYIILATIFLLASCTKTEVVSGFYSGYGTHSLVGTNVNTMMQVKRVDDNKVSFTIDFNGLEIDYPEATVFEGNDRKYYLSSPKGIQAVVQNSQIYFQYVDTHDVHNNVIFNGSKL